MVSVLGDENFDARILHGLTRRMPSVDGLQAHALGLRGLSDPALLQFASQLDRIVLTHDRRTMIDFAYERIAAGRPFAGLVYVPADLGLGRAIEELELLLSASREDELSGVVRLLPLSYTEGPRGCLTTTRHNRRSRTPKCAIARAPGAILVSTVRATKARKVGVEVPAPGGSWTALR